MLYRKKKGRLSLLCLLLCTAILLGPLQTMETYAADDSWDEEDDDWEETDWDSYKEEDSVDDTYDAVADTTTTTSSGNNYQAQINDINSKLSNLEAQKKQLETDIANAKSVKEQEQAKKNSLNYEIGVTQNEINLLMERIELLELSIVEKQQQIEEKQEEYDQSYQLFRQRLRAMQMRSETSTLGLVLGADSFVDLLTKTDTVVRIAERDRKLMEDLTEERLGLEEDKVSLEEDKAQIEQDKLDTEYKKQDLAVKVTQIQEQIQSLEELEASIAADIEANNRMTAQMQADLKAIYQQIEWDNNPYRGGVMQWPLNGYYNITSGYGWRFNNTDYHTGIDISGSNVYGKSITAANDGIVKHVNWSYVQGRGYGIYLIIDHGGNISTLYAHCSNIVVSVGDEVKKGQKVAEVGSTGWSTGPHLHFEVRENGNHVNPVSYVSG